MHPERAYLKRLPSTAHFPRLHATWWWRTGSTDVARDFLARMEPCPYRMHTVPRLNLGLHNLHPKWWSQATIDEPNSFVEGYYRCRTSFPLRRENTSLHIQACRQLHKPCLVMPPTSDRHYSLFSLCSRTMGLQLSKESSSRIVGRSLVASSPHVASST